MEEFQIIYPLQGKELNSSLESGLHSVTCFRIVEREEKHITSQGENLESTVLGRYSSHVESMYP